MDLTLTGTWSRCAGWWQCPEVADAPRAGEDYHERPRLPNGGRRAPGPRLGELPLARRDIERLRQIVGLQRRLQDLSASPRAQRAITHRSLFRDALTWLEMHGRLPAVVEHWKGVLVGEGETGGAEPAEAEPTPPRRRRRRRRRGYRPAPQ